VSRAGGSARAAHLCVVFPLAQYWQLQHSCLPPSLAAAVGTHGFLLGDLVHGGLRGGDGDCHARAVLLAGGWDGPLGLGQLGVVVEADLPLAVGLLPVNDGVAGGVLGAVLEGDVVCRREPRQLRQTPISSATMLPWRGQSNTAESEASGRVTHQGASCMYGMSRMQYGMSRMQYMHHGRKLHARQLPADILNEPASQGAVAVSRPQRPLGQAALRRSDMSAQAGGHSAGTHRSRSPGRSGR